MEFDELSRSVIGCPIEVHRNLGPSAKVPLGLLINFNVTKLQNGIKRFVL